MQRNKTVASFIKDAGQWQDAVIKLRTILKTTRLDETVKWGAPCYTYAGKNLVGIDAFKNHVGLWFFQGALLKDSSKVMISRLLVGAASSRDYWLGIATGSRSYGPLYFVCRNTEVYGTAVDIRVAPIKAYVKEAIELVDAGKEIKPVRGKPVVIPAELKAALAKDSKAATAFRKLTIGKQREYADYIAEAKRPDTKNRRLEKILPMLVANKGLHDKYRNC